MSFVFGIVNGFFIGLGFGALAVWRYAKRCGMAHLNRDTGRYEWSKEKK